jgi:hypothetical protein
VKLKLQKDSKFQLTMLDKLLTIIKTSINSVHSVAKMVMPIVADFQQEKRQALDICLPFFDPSVFFDLIKIRNEK